MTRQYEGKSFFSFPVIFSLQFCDGLLSAQLTSLLSN